jgi:glycine cleavage system H lipoate-binding protein
MFPGVDGFHWTFGHIFFLGLFFTVALTILTTTVRAIMNSVRDMRSDKAAEICWKLEFSDLPESERRCRHEIAGRVDRRTCPNAFDCRQCREYSQFAAIPAVEVANTSGLNYPADRFYHRGHTWLKRESDGTYNIGLDDLAEHLIGKPDAVELPQPGTEIANNAPAFTIVKGNTTIHVRAPIDGKVLETGGPAKGWYLKVQPPEPVNARHLLQGPEVPAWVGRELDRIQLNLHAPGAAPALADGGVLTNGLMDAMPEADWDTALAGTFLEG